MKTTFIGARFGRLIIIGERGLNTQRRVQVHCDCGVEKWVRPNCLTSGDTRSCGCLDRERRMTHGMTRTGLYQCWKRMRQRCENTRDRNYHHYGNRDIRVNPEWHNYEAFAAWAVAAGYREGLTLDRRDSNGDYTPENCRWATWSQQSQNHRRRKDNGSGYVGVSLFRRGYQCRVCLSGREIHLGLFDDPFSAAWVRDEFVKRHYDQHATLNNLKDRRRKQQSVDIDRRGTFDWQRIWSRV